jgi:hypothetical protein
MTTTQGLATYTVNSTFGATGADAMARRVAFIKEHLAGHGPVLRGWLSERKGNFDHSVGFDVVGIHTDGRILCRVTDLAGIKTAVTVGQTIAVPANRIVSFTSK